MVILVAVPEVKYLYNLHLNWRNKRSFVIIFNEMFVVSQFPVFLTSGFE